MDCLLILKCRQLTHVYKFFIIQNTVPYQNRQHDLTLCQTEYYGQEIVMYAFIRYIAAHERDGRTDIKYIVTAIYCYTQCHEAKNVYKHGNRLPAPDHKAAAKLKPTPTTVQQSKKECKLIVKHEHQQALAINVAQPQISETTYV